MSFTNAKIAGYDVEPESYHATRKRRGAKDFVVSQSMLKDFSICPRKWRSGRDRKQQTGAMAWGTLVDAILLGKASDKFAVAPAEYPHIKSKTNKPWKWEATYCREWREVQEERGYTCVSLDDWEEAQIAAQVLRTDPVIGLLLKASRRQVLVTGIWKDENTGLEIPVCALLDLVPDKDHGLFGRSLGDLKCTEAMSLNGWQKQVFQMGYHVQAAFYLDLYNAATRETRNEFHHPIQDSEPPYLVGRRSLSHEYIKMGRSRYRYEIERYAMCIATGEWPDFDNSTNGNGGWVTIDPASWMIMQDDVAPYRPSIMED